MHYIPVFLILLKWKQRKDTKKWLLKRLQRVDNCTENSSIYIVNKLDIVCTQQQLAQQESAKAYVETEVIYSFALLSLGLQRSVFWLDFPNN